jgi:hypothetical protein
MTVVVLGAVLVQRRDSLSNAQSKSLHNSHDTACKPSAAAAAHECRLQGNEAFKCKDYVLAIERYTKGYQLLLGGSPPAEPSDLAHMLTNRAAIHALQVCLPLP